MTRRSEGALVNSRVWLTIEMLLLYAAAPLAVYRLLYDFHLPLFAIFPAIFAVFATILTLDPGFSWREALSRGVSLKALASIVLVFAITGPVLAFYAWQEHPEGFLAFPRYAQGLWVMVMILYPLISVTTQEIMFRLFFFSRYGRLFGNRTEAAILVNAALFAFVHIIFRNEIAMVISFFGGLLFAWRYAQTRSYWAVVLEHTLYGNLLFTIGLGRYFYTGVPNF
jgi:uncharacterized protein